MVNCDGIDEGHTLSTISGARRHGNGNGYGYYRVTTVEHDCANCICPRHSGTHGS